VAGSGILPLTFFLVRQQHFGQHEALATGVAGVWTFSVVRFPVHPNVPGCRKPLLTDLTGEALLVRVAAALAKLASGLDITG